MVGKQGSVKFGLGFLVVCLVFSAACSNEDKPKSEVSGGQPAVNANQAEIAQIADELIVTIEEARLIHTRRSRLLKKLVREDGSLWRLYAVRAKVDGKLRPEKFIADKTIETDVDSFFSIREIEERFSPSVVPLEFSVKKSKINDPSVSNSLSTIYNATVRHSEKIKDRIAVADQAKWISDVPVSGRGYEIDFQPTNGFGGTVVFFVVSGLYKPSPDYLQVLVVNRESVGGVLTYPIRPVEFEDYLQLIYRIVKPAAVP